MLALDAPLPLRHDEPTFQPQMRASLDLPDIPPSRIKVHKHLSAPAPSSRRDRQAYNARPLPPSTHESRRFSQRTARYAQRVTSFQSTASAPARMQTVSTRASPPSQYNPLKHYLPCLSPNCNNHYTSLLLGPTFYSPQSPYQLIRKRGLCPMHAQQDLKLANQRAKKVYESMRQNCGRKTLGVIAVEFELFLHEVRVERVDESRRMKMWQKQRVLPISSAASAVGKEIQEREPIWEEEWDWRFSLRPCTNKGCEKAWYSPFDNRLYLFYTTPRPSGFMPLITLCPACAKDDVESAEERIEERRRDVGGRVGPEWNEWKEQMSRDRDLEIEYWANAQEKLVREEMGKMLVGEFQPVKTIKSRKSKRLTRLDVCVVM